MNKYYAVLGLSTTASKEEIRRKYRQLVLKWHPDRNSSPEAQGKFIAITEAYDILMGERPAPRTTTKSTYSSTAYKPAAKSKREQEKDARADRAMQLKAKFENIRQQYLRTQDFEKRKKGMYKKAYVWFAAAGAVVLLAIALPLTLIPAGNLVWTIPVAAAIGMRFLWRGGRYKLRADMIYSGRSDYSPADIQEFFMDTTGFKFQSPAGGGRAPWSR